MSEHQYVAIAVVKCRDGVERTFTATCEGECLHFKAKRHTYLLWPETEGRGFITMMPAWDEDAKRVYILAPNKWQPLAIESSNWSGGWKWEVSNE